MSRLTPFLVFIFCFIIAANISVKSQTYNFQWTEVMGGTDSDSTIDIVAGTEPYIYTCGNFWSTSMQVGTKTLTNSGSSDIFVAKYDTAGNVIWAKKFGGNTSDNAIAIAKDKFDNIYIAGKCGSASFGSIIFGGGNFILKLNSAGDVIQVVQPASDNVRIRDIGVDSSGNMVVCGNADGNGFVAKLTTTGTRIWQREIYSISSFGGGSYPGERFCYALAIAPNGRIGVCGSAGARPQSLGITTGGGADYTFVTTFTYNLPYPYPYYFGTIGFVMQWDANGNLLWIKDNLGGNTGRQATSALGLATNANGELFVSTESMVAYQPTIVDGIYYVRIAKYSNSGVMLWNRDLASYGRSIGPWLTTRSQVVTALGKVYIKYADPGGSYPRIICFSDAGYSSPIEWACSGGATVEISALAATETLYACGSWIYGTNYTNPFTTPLPTNLGGSDGFLAKLAAPPVLLPLVFSGNIPDKAICPNDSTSLKPSIFVSGGLPPYQYSWSPANTLNNATAANPIATPLTTTNYTLTVTDGAGQQLKDTITVTVLPAPATPTISQLGNTLSSTATTGNQWYLNGAPITGATNQTYTYNTAGTYTVKVTNGNGCSNSAAPYNAMLMITNPEEDEGLFSQRIAPNPVTQQATIRYELNSPSTVSVYVVNSQQERIATLVNQQRQAAGTYTYPVNQSGKGLPKGNYYVVYIINEKRRVEPIVVL